MLRKILQPKKGEVSLGYYITKNFVIYKGHMVLIDSVRGEMNVYKILVEKISWKMLTWKIEKETGA
jgi:hypothetical protein